MRVVPHVGEGAVDVGLRRSSSGGKNRKIGPRKRSPWRRSAKKRLRSMKALKGEDCLGRLSKGVGGKGGKRDEKVIVDFGCI